MSSVISVREYARRRGVSHVAVLRAIKAGRVTAVVRDAHGRVRGVDPEAADAQWTERTDVAQAERAGQMAGARVRPKLYPGEEEGNSSGTSATATDGDPHGYYAYRAEREKFQAKQARLDYLKAVGELVSVAAMRAAQTRRYRTIRDKLLNVPDRVATTLAAERDPVQVHAILTREIKRMLHELAADAASDAIVRGAGQEDDGRDE